MKFLAITTVGFAAAASAARMAPGAMSKETKFQDIHDAFQLLASEAGNFIGCFGYHTWEQSKTLTCKAENGRMGNINDGICSNNDRLSDNFNHSFAHCANDKMIKSAGLSFLKTVARRVISNIATFITSVYCGAYQADVDHDKSLGMKQDMTSSTTELTSIPTATSYSYNG